MLICGLAFTFSTPSSIHAGNVGVSVLLVQSYAISGFTKLGGLEWRNGSAVAKIMSTSSYGMGKSFVDSIPKWMWVSVAWCVISLELASVPALFTNSGDFRIAFVMLMSLFHVGTAVGMGLNTFMFAYGSALFTLLSP